MFRVFRAYPSPAECNILYAWFCCEPGPCVSHCMIFVALFALFTFAHIAEPAGPDFQLGAGVYTK